MFKKLISIAMVLSLFTVQAQAATQNGLKAAFDEMNYTLAVEWDQKDKTVYDAELKKFMNAVREAQKAGMTNADLMAFAKSTIKNEKFSKDLDTAFSMVTINKMNSEEASKYILEVLKSGQSQGASWNGGVLTTVIVSVVLVAIVVAAATGNLSVVVVDNGYYCDSYSSCYYDYYGYYTCDTLCY